LNYEPFKKKLVLFMDMGPFDTISKKALVLECSELALLVKDVSKGANSVKGT